MDTFPGKVEKRYSFSFEVSEEVRALYDEARELIGPVQIAEVFEKTLREFVQKRKPKKTRKVPVKTAAPLKPSRVISRPIRRAVLDRDGRQCSYVSPDGKRCTERCGLQIDHIVPFARGGGNEAENLRAVCRTHNMLFAEREFGVEFMNRFRELRR